MCVGRAHESSPSSNTPIRGSGSKRSEHSGRSIGARRRLGLAMAGTLPLNAGSRFQHVPGAVNADPTGGWRGRPPFSPAALDCRFGARGDMASMLDLLERHPKAAAISAEPPFAGKLNVVTHLMGAVPTRPARSWCRWGSRRGGANALRVEALRKWASTIRPCHRRRGLPGRTQVEPANLRAGGPVWRQLLFPVDDNYVFRFQPGELPPRRPRGWRRTASPGGYGGGVGSTSGFWALVARPAFRREGSR